MNSKKYEAELKKIRAQLDADYKKMWRDARKMKGIGGAHREAAAHAYYTKGLKHLAGMGKQLGAMRKRERKMTERGRKTR